MIYPSVKSINLTQKGKETQFIQMNKTQNQLTEGLFSDLFQ